MWTIGKKEVVEVGDLELCHHQLLLKLEQEGEGVLNEQVVQGEEGEQIFLNPLKKNPVVGQIHVENYQYQQLIHHRHHQMMRIKVMQQQIRARKLEGQETEVVGHVAASFVMEEEWAVVAVHYF